MEAYRQKKVLGQGSFGKALLAEHRATGNLVVIKTIDLHGSKAELADARNEAELLQSLRHRNIVTYITSFEHKGQFCIVMEHACAGDLGQRIKARGSKMPSERQVMQVFVQLCEALYECHRRKILHRDLKPQNVFLDIDLKTKSLVVKLGDFGVARMLQSTHALAKTQVGTPYYFSPELFHGKEYNSKSDMWSLGCLLYEMCELHPPFQANSLPALMNKVVHHPAPRITSQMYSPDFRDLVDALLQKNPRHRPSAEDILNSTVVAMYRAADAQTKQRLPTHTDGHEHSNHNAKVNANANVKVENQMWHAKDAVLEAALEKERLRVQLKMQRAQQIRQRKIAIAAKKMQSLQELVRAQKAWEQQRRQQREQRREQPEQNQHRIQHQHNTPPHDNRNRHQPNADLKQHKKHSKPRRREQSHQVNENNRREEPDELKHNAPKENVWNKRDEQRNAKNARHWQNELRDHKERRNSHDKPPLQHKKKHCGDKKERRRRDKKDHRQQEARQPAKVDQHAPTVVRPRHRHQHRNREHTPGRNRGQDVVSIGVGNQPTRISPGRKPRLASVPEAEVQVQVLDQPVSSASPSSDSSDAEFERKLREPLQAANSSLASATMLVVEKKKVLPPRNNDDNVNAKANVKRPLKSRPVDSDLAAIPKQLFYADTVQSSDACASAPKNKVRSIPQPKVERQRKQSKDGRERKKRNSEQKGKASSKRKGRSKKSKQPKSQNDQVQVHYPTDHSVANNAGVGELEAAKTKILHDIMQRQGIVIEEESTSGSSCPGAGQIRDPKIDVDALQVNPDKARGEPMPLQMHMEEAEDFDCELDTENELKSSTDIISTISANHENAEDSWLDWLLPTRKATPSASMSPIVDDNSPTKEVVTDKETKDDSLQSSWVSGTALSARTFVQGLLQKFA